MPRCYNHYGKVLKKVFGKEVIVTSGTADDRFFAFFAQFLILIYFAAFFCTYAAEICAETKVVEIQRGSFPTLNTPQTIYQLLIVVPCTACATFASAILF